jgi:tetratricopeptide (TPR) repeat protein
MKLPGLNNLLFVASLVIVTVTASAQPANRLNLVYCYNLPTINSDYYIAFNQDNMATKTNILPYNLSVANNNRVVLTPGKSYGQSGYNFAETAKNNLRINISDQQNTGYTKSVVRHPDVGFTIGGVVCMGVGAAIILSRPIPKFNEDEKLGPQILFGVGCVLAGSGILYLYTGISNYITVYQPVAYPDLSTDRMKMMPTEENRRVQTSIAELLKSGHITAYDKVNKTSGIPENVTTYDDRIEFMINNNKTLFYFEDVYLNGVTYGYNKKIEVGNMQFRRDRDIATLNKLKDSLIYIREQLRIELENQKYSGQLDAFKPLAAKYRAMDEKPTMTEALRKKIVQADVYREQNQFVDAINMLISAMEMDPIAYPLGYSNIAYLYERQKKYQDAILNMKKYLLLEPFADDARQSQDKIYEWELLLNK